MTVILSIADFVERVRVARLDVAATDAFIKAKNAQHRQSLSEHYEILAETKATLEDAEQQLRTLVETHFRSTGEKRPHPSVTVRESRPRTVCEYDESKALAYALERGIALRLDPEALERFLIATPEPMRPDWFRVRTETPAPTVAIAREIPEPTEPEL